MNLPRAIVNDQRVISIPYIHEYVKGIASALFDSITCYSCIYLISLLIPPIKAWMLQKNKIKKHNRSSNLQKHKPIRKDKNGLKPKQKP